MHVAIRERISWIGNAVMIVAILTGSILGSAVSAQARADSEAEEIEVRGGFLSKSYYYHGEKVKGLDGLVAIMKDHPEAQAQANSAKGLRAASMGLACVGGAMIGWPIGGAIGGQEDPAWALAAGGAAITGISLLMGAKADSRVEKGVHMYNTALAGRASLPARTVHLALLWDRVAVIVRF